MNKYKYIVTTCMIKVEDTDIQSYGIACVQNGNEECCIHDISTDKRLIEEAVNKFNKYKLLPVHFEEAVEDILTCTYSID